MVKSVNKDKPVTAPAAPPEPPARRAPDAGTRVSYTVLRQWLKLAKACSNDDAPATDPSPAHALQAGLVATLGRYADPDYNPPRRASSWQVTRKGETTTHNSLASAAKAYGASPASLRVMLSRGNGRCANGVAECIAFS